MIRLILAISFLSASLPAAGIEVRHNIEFARPDGEPLLFDAHIPPGPGPHAAVILVHGGGWTTGSKQADFIQPLFKPLDESGLAWFSIDYRLAPRHPYPEAVRDVEEAIRYIKAHAKDYRVDPKRLALMGESAGGHLVALVATRATPETHVAAVVPFYGAFDLEALLAGKKEVSNGWTAFFRVTDLSDKSRAVLREASAATYVKRGLPPFLLIHGTKDEAVPYDQSVKFNAQLKAVGVKTEFYTVENGIHGVINWEKVPEQHSYKPVMVKWLRKTLKVR